MMRVPLVITLGLSAILVSCGPGTSPLSTNADDAFYVDNDGAAMSVRVQGNTASKIFVLIAHGGPGGTAYGYNVDAMNEGLESSCAVAYWDQRNSGASQGGCNADELHLPQFADDLKKIIQALKFRYGTDISVFIMGHSWGGLVTAAFITKDGNQSMVKGWIFASGSHNYPLNDTLTREKLLAVGQEQIAQNQHVSEWNEIIQYCNSHGGPFTYDEDMQLTTYAWQAMSFMDSMIAFDEFGVFEQNFISDRIPITSVVVNVLNPAFTDLAKEVVSAEFSSQLYKVTVPVLVIEGKYDFVCPEGLGDDVLARVSTDSTEKRKVILPRSGHDLQEMDIVTREVSDFAVRYR